MKKLRYPNSYLLIDKEEVCNGCGAKGGIPVPNTFYGLDIEEACNIHDYMYSIGKTIEDKHKADNIFNYNLKVLISNGGGWKILRLLRHLRRKEYVLAVTLWGDSAYWKGKEKV